MSRTQFSTTVPEETRRRADAISARTGYTYREIVILGVNTLFQEGTMSTNRPSEIERAAVTILHDVRSAVVHPAVGQYIDSLVADPTYADLTPEGIDVHALYGTPAAAWATYGVESAPDTGVLALDRAAYGLARALAQYRAAGRPDGDYVLSLGVNDWTVHTSLAAALAEFVGLLRQADALRYGAEH